MKIAFKLTFFLSKILTILYISISHLLINLCDGYPSNFQSGT